MNITSNQTTSVNCNKTKTISLRNSIQALLEANDNLFPDPCKFLTDPEDWGKNGGTGGTLFGGGGKSGSLTMLEQIGKCVSQSDDMMASLLRQVRIFEEKIFWLP